MRIDHVGVDVEIFRSDAHHLLQTVGCCVCLFLCVLYQSEKKEPKKFHQWKLTLND
jgi:hypothetical protein